MARLPLIVLVLFGLGLAMVVVVIAAVALGDMRSLAVFGTWGCATLTVAVMVSLVRRGIDRRSKISREAAALVIVYTVIPAIAALPLVTLIPQLSFEVAYFEMMSALTTTGATIFEDPDAIPLTAHLWRSVVAWLGGYLILVVAFAIMAPLNIGGFELSTQTSRMAGRDIATSTGLDSGIRIIRIGRLIGPIYLALTFGLGVFLFAAGDSAIVAMCHAMGVLSTSGISPVGGLAAGQAGFFGEVAITVFLVLALSHRIASGVSLPSLKGDPEIRLGVGLIIGATLFLFLLHFAASYDTPILKDLLSAVRALWGSFFTVISFLTTTGYVSDEWNGAIAWAGLDTAGLVLFSLALIGGGVATTAGGVKLLRIYALYKHGNRELERLVHPSSIGGSGSTARRIRRQGAFIAWIFVMMFVLTSAVIFLALSLTGVEFSSAFVMMVSTLSNTGPLLETFGTEFATYQDISPAARRVLCVSMLLGRLEVLAVVAVLNPVYWQR